MSIPNHTILAATEADIPILTGFLQDSKLHLAINRFLFRDWPAEAAQCANYRSAVEFGVKNPQTTSLKVVNDASGKIVAHMYLRRMSDNENPDTPSESDESDSEKDEQSQNVDDKQDEDKNQDQSQIPDIFVPEVYEKVVEAMNQIEPEITGDHYELTHIYVDPASRRQGIGTQLIQVCHDRAQAEKLPLTICVEPNHHDFFVKQGFKDEKYVDIDLRQWAAENSGYGNFRISRMNFVMSE
ncbi:uncharacterized protein F4822DRAFT_288148 [Hypoxylon trugodes]|uniref:uncharacterized protein n=1 Tax=Hypoxylon trugodes TaxID=326681 RepID=UPI00218D5B74|nr:uncharacterized protein F4822DRAFT_288148 [Hypoxylon trugodes]KAI1387598.1 hypothetical protein F4822DRAFT_288148 [Hypoxylon trugodes]